MPGFSEAVWQELPVLRAHFLSLAVVLQVQLAGEPTASPAGLLEKLGPVSLPLCRVMPKKRAGELKDLTEDKKSAL